MRHRAAVGAIAAITSVLLVLLCAPFDDAHAQMRPGIVQLSKVTGPVEVQRQGQGPWTRIAAGGQLSERDHIRALAGGAADLVYPDGSLILLSENSRLAITKVAFDATTQDRNFLAHVPVGKIRVETKKAAVQLVRARQTTFNISTPSGVAAIRGSVVDIVVASDGRVLVAVTPSFGQNVTDARVTFHVTKADGTPVQVTVNITGNQFTTTVGDGQASPPQPVSALPATTLQGLGTRVNQVTRSDDPQLTATVRLVTAEQMNQIIQRSGEAVQGVGQLGVGEIKTENEQDRPKGKDVSQ